MPSKVCPMCGKTLLLNYFYKKASNKEGYDTLCKTCRIKKYSISTDDRYIKNLYMRQIHNSIKRDMYLPTYTLMELKTWIQSQVTWHTLWDNYKNANYQTELAPSIDRINPNISYTLQNIQLVTWKDNAQHEHADVSQNIHHRNQKPVNQYDLNGNFIKTFPSIKSALESLGVRNLSGTAGIQNVCNHKMVKLKGQNPYLAKTYKGYRWEWA